MERRRLLASVGAVLAGSQAGCLAGRESGEGADPSATDDPDDTPTGDSPSPGTGTADPPSHEESMNEPDPDLSVRGENRHDAAHSVAVVVSREAGDVVHEATHELAPGADRELYNVGEANPAGIETFAVEATLDGRTESVEVETSTCYGPVLVSITEDGGLYLTYAIC